MSAGFDERIAGDGHDAAWIARLLRPAAFPHPVGTLKLIETHISWLLLTGEWVYKIKKPLDLSFLDFSTLAARRHFCEEELRLNRRFAPQLYMDVVPIWGEAEPDLIETAHRGEAPVEYAVRMRQFDQRNLLDAVAERGEFDCGLVRRLARRLATLHTELPAWTRDDAYGQVETVAAAMQQNFGQIAAYGLDAATGAELATVSAWTARQLQLHESLMRRRRLDGFVRECHGDPHLGNITLWQGEPLLFDCIEFNPAFRIVDTIAELAFLAMDLEARRSLLAKPSGWQRPTRCR